ncbi:MAG: BrnT family toxin [Hyphomicrobiales bacterium]
MIFDGPVQTVIDDRKDYGEVRLIALGEVDGVVLVVVYTDRGDVRRIISARYANKKERELWRSFVEA